MVLRLRNHRRYTNSIISHRYPKVKNVVKTKINYFINVLNFPKNSTQFFGVFSVLLCVNVIKFN